MKRFELILGLIAILAIVLKLFQIPGSSLLIVFALSTLSMFYYVFSFAFFNGIKLRDILKKASYKETNAKRIIGAIGFGFSLSAITIGGLFKLQLWAGASLQLMSGLVTSGLVLFVATIFYSRSKSNYYRRIFKRIAIYGGLGLVLYLTPAATLVDIYYYGGNHEYTELYKKVLADPNNHELKIQLEQMRREMFEQALQEELKKTNN